MHPFPVSGRRSKLPSAVSEARTQMWTIQTVYYKFYILYVHSLVFSSNFPTRPYVNKTFYKLSLTMHANAYPVSHELLLAMCSSFSQGHYHSAITHLTCFLFWLFLRCPWFLVLLSPAVCLAPQLLLLVVFLVFPQPSTNERTTVYVPKDLSAFFLSSSQSLFVPLQKFFIQVCALMGCPVLGRQYGCPFWCVILLQLFPCKRIYMHLTQTSRKNRT